MATDCMGLFKLLHMHHLPFKVLSGHMWLVVTVLGVITEEIPKDGEG